MNRVIKFLFLLLLVVLEISCGSADKSAVLTTTQPVPLGVQIMKPTSVKIVHEFATNLEGQQNVEIRPKINGFIKKIYIDEGQKVHKGQLLFTIETNALSQDAETKKAQIRVYQVEVDRLKPLVEQEIISIVQLETAKANLDRALSDYNSTIENIRYSTIISPTNGVIGSLPFKEGSLVSPTMSEPMTTVSNVNKIRAYFSINEKEYFGFIREYKAKNRVTLINEIPPVTLIMADNTPYAYKGKIETINGLINKATGSVEFRAVFENPDLFLRSGGSGTIQIPQNLQNIYLIPQSSLFEIQDKQLVYLVGANNKVYAKSVQIAGTSGNNYIVKNGLKNGDTLVLDDVFKLREGQEVVPQLK